MYLDFDEYPPYRNALPESFEIKININLRFCHGHPNTYGNYKENTWVKKKTWDMFDFFSMNN